MKWWAEDIWGILKEHLDFIQNLILKFLELWCTGGMHSYSHSHLLHGEYSLLLRWTFWDDFAEWFGKAYFLFKETQLNVFGVF